MPADLLVQGELRDLTNTLNAWRGSLHRWYVWLEVLDGFTPDEAWEMQWEFVESIAFHCLFYPSATRDRFTLVATNALHQVRLALEAGYADQLACDSSPGREHKNHVPSRKDRELQLASVVRNIDGESRLMEAIRALDGEHYRSVTSNFRNLASHALPPGLTVGYTRMVTRDVIPATRLVERGPREFHEEPIPGRQMVSYAVGGLAPLPMRELFMANLSEFQLAKLCFDAYTSTLNAELAKMSRA